MLRIIVDRQPNSFAGRTVGVARRDLKFGVRDNGGNDLKSFSEIRSDKLGLAWMSSLRNPPSLSYGVAGK
jgi:hypothetical protein